jgi:signal transduction histidine kinase
MTPQLVGRLMAPVAALSVLLLVIAFGSAWYVRGLQRSVSDVMTNNVESVRAAQELEISIRETRTQFDRYLITLDKKHLEPVPRMRQRTAEAVTAVEQTATTPQEQTLMKRVRGGYDHFFAQYDEILQNQKRPLYADIIELVDTVLVKEILDPAHEYLALNEGMLTQNTRANHELADRLTTGLIALGLCGAAGGLLGGAVIVVALRRSFLKAERRLQSTADQLDQAVRQGVSAGTNGVPGDAVERMSLSASAVLLRLRQTEKDALRAEQLAWVGQMAAGIAHEIRNPLMAIKLLVQAAAERREGTGFRPRDLQVLEEEIVRLEQIVSGFLDFSRPPRLDPRPVDVKELAERVAAGVQARAELQGVAVRVEPATGPTVASADPNQLRQVLFNLLFNALDAQPQGGRIGVRVGIHPAADGSPELLVAVEDGGPGLPADLGDRVFEPFVSTKETGLGLGLSICRRIAETHGGGLTAAPAAAGGTVFTLRLPVVRPSGLSLHALNS